MQATHIVPEGYSYNEYRNGILKFVRAAEPVPVAIEQEHDYDYWGKLISDPSVRVQVRCDIAEAIE